MARNRRLILSSPSRVWGLLSEGHRYGEWVSGTREVTAADPDWPDVGSRLRVRVGVGPLTLDDVCVVRHSEPERRLELEAKADPFGAARIALHLIPWAGNTLLELDWHPLRGPGTRMHGLPVDYLVSIRNGMMLTKLARIAVREQRAGADADVRTGAGAEAGAGTGGGPRGGGGR
ncbi:SRPBCC family protein [Streptomyces sp. NPDC052077]|uniref:SRPBCC family protein n=1 Tax=Streptomyces sp. NPDC052077 TaxID=3154757 RepID=UPI003419F543